MTLSLDPRVVELLRKAGWTEGYDGLRDRKIQNESAFFPAAHTVLTNFGGLDVGYMGTGIETGTSSIQFDLSFAFAPPEEIDPPHSRPIWPIGELDHGHAGLYIDDLGKVFMMTDSFELIAPSIELALYSLLLGIRLSPEELAAG